MPDDIPPRSTPDDLAVEDPGPPPTPPREHECCGRACDPCIWTYHHRALQRWKERVALWQEARGLHGRPSSFHNPFDG